MSSNSVRFREARAKRREAESSGPLPAKLCTCEKPVTYREPDDNELRCICGRPARTNGR